MCFAHDPIPTRGIPKEMIKRIIPRLDIKGPNLVKGIQMEGLRVMGPPAFFAQRYYEEGADELIFIDTVASLYGRDHLLSILEQTTQDVFVPVTAGGGVRTLDDIKALLRAGADKVLINTTAVDDPNFITQAARHFGSQCIVLYIEAKKRVGWYEVMTNNARESTGRDVLEWAKTGVQMGAGEILVLSVDHDGTGMGIDTNLAHQIALAVDVPVIASGGVGKIEDVDLGFQDSNVDAIAIATMFHYKLLPEVWEMGYKPDIGDTLFLGGTRTRPDQIVPASISDTKGYLKEKGRWIRR